MSFSPVSLKLKIARQLQFCVNDHNQCDDQERQEDINGDVPTFAVKRYAMFAEQLFDSIVDPENSIDISRYVGINIKKHFFPDFIGFIRRNQKYNSRLTIDLFYLRDQIRYYFRLVRCFWNSYYCHLTGIITKLASEIAKKFQDGVKRTYLVTGRIAEPLPDILGKITMIVVTKQICHCSFHPGILR